MIFCGQLCTLSKLVIQTRVCERVRPKLIFLLGNPLKGNFILFPYLKVSPCKNLFFFGVLHRVGKSQSNVISRLNITILIYGVHMVPIHVTCVHVTIMVIRDRPRFFDQVGHQTPSKISKFWVLKLFLSVLNWWNISKRNFCEEYLIRRWTYINDIFWKLYFIVLYIS